jgi:excisionase family DNA binding protein
MQLDVAHVTNRHHQQPLMAVQRLVDIDAVAVYLSLTPAAVSHMVQRHQIPFVRLGRRVRFDLRQIDRWVERQQFEAAG